MKKQKIFTILVLFITFIAVLYTFHNVIIAKIFAPTTSSIPLNTLPKTDPTKESKDIEIIADNLNIPWEIAFLPSGEILVTQRSGQLLKIGADKTVIKIEGVTHIGEGGLLGMALHPNFKENNWIYLYLTTENNFILTNKVERYKFINNNLTEKTEILSNIPASRNHDGGRIAFGPDGYLYITTGDAGNPASAQNKNELSGKILKVTDDGSIPSNNPFGTLVYSYGHRNPQGITWDKDGKMWATEHGRSGTQSGFDELNLIEAGKNYGWPEIEGDEVNELMVSPVIHFGANDTWAPSGIAYINETLYFAGLRGSALYRVLLNKNNEISMFFRQEFGRLRTVVVGPDGYIYITTNNTDGRGTLNENDDKLIKINPEILQ